MSCNFFIASIWDTAFTPVLITLDLLFVNLFVKERKVTSGKLIKNFVLELKMGPITIFVS